MSSSAGRSSRQMIMASDAACTHQKVVKSIHVVFIRTGAYSGGPMELAARTDARGAGMGE